MGIKKLLNKHPSLHYHKKHCSVEEAMSCWHVQTAAKHHKVNLVTLAKAMAGGINLVSAIISIAQFL